MTVSRRPNYPRVVGDSDGIDAAVELLLSAKKPVVFGATGFCCRKLAMSCWSLLS